MRLIHGGSPPQKTHRRSSRSTVQQLDADTFEIVRAKQVIRQIGYFQPRPPIGRRCAHLRQRARTRLRGGFSSLLEAIYALLAALATRVSRPRCSASSAFASPSLVTGPACSRRRDSRIGRYATLSQYMAGLGVLEAPQQFDALAELFSMRRRARASFRSALVS